MSDMISKDDVREGINIIKSGLALAGLIDLMEVTSEGTDSLKGRQALGRSEGFAESVQGLDAFLADLADFGTK